MKFLLILLVAFSAHSAAAGIENDLCLNENFDLAQEVAFEKFGVEVETLELYTNLASEQMHWDAGKYGVERVVLQAEKPVKTSDALGLVFVSRVRNDVHDGVKVGPTLLVLEEKSQIKGIEQRLQISATTNLKWIEEKRFQASDELESATPYAIDFDLYESEEEIAMIRLDSLSLYKSFWTHIIASKVHMCAYMVVKP